VIAAVVALGLVVGEASMRVAPREEAPLAAKLTPGDAVELRGERGGYLQIYDPRRERGGYVRPALVRETPATPEAAPALLAIVRFLRETPGQESLGIAYVAAYLRAAPAKDIGAEIFDALGTLGERLGRRASHKVDRAESEQILAQLDVAQAYGVRFLTVEHEGRTELCDAGEAYRRVLALPDATAEQRARAAFGLTRTECVDPSLTSTAHAELLRWQLEVLQDRVDAAALPAHLAARLHLRRAGVAASLAFFEERLGRHAPATDAAMRAAAELALADPTSLADDDRALAAETAARVAATRWAAEPGPASKGTLALVVREGEPGETCLSATSKGKQQVERCTHGVVWASSMRVAPGDQALVVAVQPTETWRELWVFHHAASGWIAEVLTPSSATPGLGSIDAAGFSPDGTRLLTAREARTPGHNEREFAVVELTSLAVLKRASRVETLPEFRRWGSVAWRSTRLAQR
jgi:hypothetical protein